MHNFHTSYFPLPFFPIILYPIFFASKHAAVLSPPLQYQIRSNSAVSTAMSKPHGHHPPSGRTNLASCIVATIFLIFLVIVVLIVFFTVFKPQDPKIAVSAVQLPSFSVAHGTINFTFSQYVSVRNLTKLLSLTTTVRFSSSTPVLKLDSCSFPPVKSTPVRRSTW